MYILKGQKCPSPFPFLYQSFYNILTLSTIPFFSLKVHQLLAELVHWKLQHPLRRVFVLLPLSEPLRFRPHSPVYSGLPATPRCWANFTDRGQRWRALTVCTLKREPPLLLAWFNSCSLIKLFKMCSWHFNTHFQFEFDYTFGVNEWQ